MTNEEKAQAWVDEKYPGSEYKQYEREMAFRGFLAGAASQHPAPDWAEIEREFYYDYRRNGITRGILEWFKQRIETA